MDKWVYFLEIAIERRQNIIYNIFRNDFNKNKSSGHSGSKYVIILQSNIPRKVYRNPVDSIPTQFPYGLLLPLTILRSLSTGYCLYN